MFEAAESAASRTLVSVVVPVYNRFDQAISAIKSVLAQTHRAIEIIVVDDGSTQDIRGLTQFVARHSNIRFLKQANQGEPAARNLGWAHASGQYVAFLDTDDLFLPEKIDIQLRAMLREKSYFSHTSYWRHDAREPNLIACRSGRLGGKESPAIIGQCSIAVPTVMLRRDLWDEGFRFPEGGRLGNDVVLFIRIAQQNEVQGIDQMLTIVRTGVRSAAYSHSDQVNGTEYIIAAMQKDHVLSQYK